MADSGLCGIFDLFDACEVEGMCCCEDERRENETDELLGVV